MIKLVKAISLRLLWWVNMLMAALLLGTYFASVISPASFTFFAILALAYPFFLLINLLFVGFWIYHRSRAVYLSLLIIVLGGSFIPKVFSFHYNKTAPPEAIRFMTYNVRYFNTPVYAQEKKWLRDQDRMLEYIKKMQPAIFCGQEFAGKGKASSKRADEYLRKELQLTHQHRGGGSSLAIMSKYPLENKGVINFQGTFNGAIHADVVLPNQQTIRVYAIHLQSTRLGKDARELLKKKNITSLNKKETQEKYYRISSKLQNAFELRAAQAKIIAGHAAESPYPVVICGDFNDTPMSYAYKLLAKGRKDSFIEKGSGLGASYAGGLPALRIDYILLDKEFDAFNHILQQKAISDHRALVSDLRLHLK